MADMTNYEQIKNMSIEEMAELIIYCIENLLEDVTTLECLCCEEPHCTKCVINWLNSEVDDG